MMIILVSNCDSSVKKSHEGGVRESVVFMMIKNTVKMMFDVNDDYSNISDDDDDDVKNNKHQ